MNIKNEKIIKSVVNKINNDYAEDVALLLIYGSYVNGTSNELSDVDFYFIPKTERGYGLSRTFIINGIGYDLFPMSWTRVEGISEFKEPLTPLVANVRIEYYHSEEDLNKFKMMQEKLQMNLSNEKFMKAVVEKNLDQAMSKYTKLVLANHQKVIRTLSGEILLLVADAVAYMNQTYFKNGLKQQLHDLKTMQVLPHRFIELYGEVIHAERHDDICQAVLEIIKETIGLQDKLQRTSSKIKSKNYHDVKGVYEELVSTWNKVKVCCELGNKELAFISGLNLQGTLDWLSDDYDLPEHDLLGSYQAEALMEFYKKSEAIRVEIVERLELNGVEITDYETVEAYENGKE